jgi:hypothetical protein
MQLEESIVIQSNEKSFELLALDEALEELAKIRRAKSKIVRTQIFRRLVVAETRKFWASPKSPSNGIGAWRKRGFTIN